MKQNIKENKQHLIDHLLAFEKNALSNLHPLSQRIGYTLAEVRGLVQAGEILKAGYVVRSFQEFWFEKYGEDIAHLYRDRQFLEYIMKMIYHLVFMEACEANFEEFEELAQEIDARAVEGAKQAELRYIERRNAKTREVCVARKEQ